MLLWRSVPGDEVEIMAYCSVPEFLGVANHGLEIAFRRGYEVCVIHEDSSWQIIPSPYTVFDKLSC